MNNINKYSAQSIPISSLELSGRINIESLGFKGYASQKVHKIFGMSIKMFYGIFGAG